ncbi:MAG TPA: hypothetical protein VKT73_05790 [Xanthobacteraceae bacterium]|nr:hypothetical protein [Xanthobacteraceae bacterium]
MNHSQATLQTVRRTNPLGIQILVGLGLAAVVVIFGLIIASQATSQESMMKKEHAATANVLPQLFISDEALKPNLNGVLATGDGGAMLPAEETIGGISRGRFDRR